MGPTRVDYLESELESLRKTVLFNGFGRLYGGALMAFVVLVMFPPFDPVRARWGDGHSFTLDFPSLLGTRGGARPLVPLAVCLLVILMTVMTFRPRPRTPVIPLLTPIPAAGLVVVMLNIPHFAEYARYRIDSPPMSGAGRGCVILLATLMVVNIVHAVAIVVTHPKNLGSEHVVPPPGGTIA